MATKFSIYCGTDAPHIDAVSCEDLARNLAAQYFPNGHSVRVEDGCWKMNTGEVVNERTIVITWYTDSTTLSDNVVGKMASDYKNLARQEAVLVESQAVDTFFI